MAFRFSGGGGGGGGGITALSGASDAAIISPAVGYEMRYAVSRWRESLPGDLHLWDYILDQLNGSAYSTSHRLFGLSITSGAAVLTSQTDQFTSAMVGRTIRVDQAGAAGGVLETTVNAYTNARSVTLAANASSTVTLKGVGRIRGTNVTAAFNAWLSDLGTRRVRGIMPRGTFNLDGNHEVPDDAWIEGSGHNDTILMLVNGVSANTDVLRTKGFATLNGNTGTTNGNRAARGFGLAKFMIDGDFRSNANGRYGLAAYAFDWYLREVLVSGAKSSAIYSACNMTSGNTPHQLGTGPGGIHLYWHRVMVQNSADSGRQVDFLGPHDSYIQGLDVYKDGSYSSDGLYVGHTGVGGGVDGGGGSQISDVHVWGNHTVGVNVASGGTLLDNIQSEGADLNCRIAGARIKLNHGRFYGVVGTASDEGIEFASGSNNVATNIKIEDCDVAAVRITSAPGLWFTGSAETTTASPPAILAGTPPATAHIWLMNQGGYQDHFVQSLFTGQEDIAWEERFVTGANATSGLGANGLQANGTVTLQAPETGAYGIVRVATGAASGTIAYIADRGNATVGTMLPAATGVHTKFKLRHNHVDADTRLRVGLVVDVTNGTITDGIYFEKLEADTNWFCVTRAAGVQTRTDTGVAATTSGFHVFEIQKSGTSWLFYLNRVLEATHTSGQNIPTAALKVAATCRNNAAADKTFDVTYVASKMRAA